MISLLRYLADLEHEASMAGCGVLVSLVSMVRSGAAQTLLERVLPRLAWTVCEIVDEMFRNRAIIRFWLVKLLEQAEDREVTAIEVAGVPLFLLLGRLPTVAIVTMVVGEVDREVTITMSDIVKVGDSTLIVLTLPSLLPLTRGDDSPILYLLLREAIRLVPTLLGMSMASEDDMDTARTVMELASQTFMNLEIAYSNLLGNLSDLVEHYYRLFRRFTVRDGDTLREATGQALALGLVAETWPRRVKLYARDTTIRHARELLRYIAQIVQVHGLGNLATRLVEIAEKT